MTDIRGLLGHIGFAAWHSWPQALLDAADRHHAATQAAREYEAILDTIAEALDLDTPEQMRPVRDAFEHMAHCSGMSPHDIAVLHLRAMGYYGTSAAPDDHVHTNGTPLYPPPTADPAPFEIRVSARRLPDKTYTWTCTRHIVRECCK